MHLVCHGLVFLAAALLFQVELIAAKAMLPGFGGSSLVWAAAMLAFQVFLLGGYAWAAWVGSRLERPWGRALHGALLLVMAGMFPLHLEALSTPGVVPIPWPEVAWADIACMLALTVGPAFVMLATVSVVCQRLLAMSSLPQAARPYGLYAMSNLGSFVGLLSYPVMVEPFFDLDVQLMAWQVGYLLVVALQALVLWRLRPTPQEAVTAATAPAAVSPRVQARWLLLAAAGSAMFIATTNVITMDLASIPLLWIVPISLYLLSFVLVFKNPPWLPAWVRSRFALALAVGSLLFLLASLSYHLPVQVALPAYWLTLLAVCLVCHGELSRTAPKDPRRLGRFYLLLSLGGALGSLLAGYVAPLVATSLAEYPAALCLAAAAVSMGEQAPRGPGRRTWWDRPARVLGMLALVLAWPVVLTLWPEVPTNLLAGCAGMGVAVLYFRLETQPRTAAYVAAMLLAATQLLPGLVPGRVLHSAHRNFYGITTVYDSGPRRHLKHGTTLHGSQFLDPARAGEALTYYHVTTPSGALLARQEEALDAVHPLGLVGLGTGSLAVYARPGQAVDIFELDPHNGQVASTWFSFLDHSPGELRLTFGDARLTLRGVAAGRYGILVVDAFNSDSIPVHLLTREALGEYGRVLREDGLLLLHVSNKYLDLPPVVQATGQAAGWLVLEKAYVGTVHSDAEACVWMALTRDPATAARLVARFGWRDLRNQPQVRSVRPWTDRFSNVLGVLR
ncbi:MAG: fused MFS/spermidine synthase [Desulfovibrio sp.]|nr:fused MFS/spermidine synthase [Desulfovibrio sp.]